MMGYYKGNSSYTIFTDFLNAKNVSLSILKTSFLIPSVAVKKCDAILYHSLLRPFFSLWTDLGFCFSPPSFLKIHFSKYVCVSRQATWIKCAWDTLVSKSKQFSLLISQFCSLCKCPHSLTWMKLLPKEVNRHSLLFWAYHVCEKLKE